MGLFEVPSWDVGKVVVAETKKRKKRPVNQAAKRSVIENEGKMSPILYSDKTPLSDASSTTKDAKACSHGKPTREAQISKLHSQNINPTSTLPSASSRNKGKIEAKLSGARFRFLNQKLYESSSAEALVHFQRNPEDFVRYHEGFREQTKTWPVNPVNIFINRLYRTSSSKGHGHLVVVDMGCGDAIIGQTFHDHKQVVVKSYDLVASNEFVEVGNMTTVPLSEASVDVVIFCLSLMNTDHLQAIREAHRILKPNGSLWIAEVSSRLEGARGLKAFEEALQTLGFSITSKDMSNSVFFVLFANKVTAKIHKVKTPSNSVLKPCLYKKR